jgi:tRNA1(Val) A37 N6-methylase TrmN6
MALIFPRLARNFVKNGYFPTDEETLARIVSAIDIDGAGVRIVDPCCGEGAALAEAKRHLVECGATVEALGIEFDQERAWHAKQWLDTVIHSDVNDVFLTHRSCGLLFLNPPYGDVVSDKAGTGDIGKRERLEKIFLRKTMSYLQFGGVLVLIVPHYVLDSDFANLIARNFQHVEVYLAPEQQFKQAVIFGIKRRADQPDPATVEKLVAVGLGELPPELPAHWSGEPFLVPAMPSGSLTFIANRIDAPQLQEELTRLSSNTLWPRFTGMFGNQVAAPRRPLRDLSKWHLALALAAGQISGLVKSTDGRTYLIKGDTFKEKEKHVDIVENEDGSITETTIMTDKFVPVIKGIDFTPGPHYGEIVTIR